MPFSHIYAYDISMNANVPSRNQPCPCGSGRKFKHCCADLQRGGTKPHRPSQSELSTQTSLDQAIQLHRQGRLRQAAGLYLSVLQRQPDHADALHLLGLIRHQTGDQEAALELVSKAISLQPDSAIFHNNLGEICRALGRFERAESHYTRALTLQADFAEAHRNLGLAYLDSGQVPRAVAHLTESVKRHPQLLGGHWALGQAHARLGDHTAALRSLERGLELNPADPALLCAKGITLRAQGTLDLAIEHYRQAIQLRPDVAELHHNLALLYQKQGQVNEAIACLEHELRLSPNSESAEHLLAALQQRPTARAPASYVRETFDFYADSFDSHLVDKLEYQTPKLLVDLLRATAPALPANWTILDLGCGTGLFGEQVLPIKRHLIGVDLSPRMVEKARQRGIYDELVVGDLLDQFDRSPDARFDLVAAADVFNYLGDLQPIFQHIRRILTAGGWFCFSIEAAAAGSKNYVLDITGRYRHNSQYLDQLASQSGLALARKTNVCLRKENGQPVEGYLYLLRKSP
jgi:predicted TPR repeat methyltransferase